MRPFPQVATGTAPLAEQWTDYRRAMLDYAGIAIFVFGNKRDSSGTIVHSNGMKEEFNLCVARGAHAIPIGATGYMANELWLAMTADLLSFYPGASPEFVADFQRLGGATKSLDDLRPTIQRLIEHLQKT